MVDKYSASDIHSINELGCELNSDFSKLFHIDDINNSEIIYVYKINNLVKGFIHIAISFEIVDIINIITDRNYRKVGIASTLMEYMIKNLPQDVEKIMLEVNATNKEAISFYIKEGFNEINRRKNYYDNCDAIIMERKIK